MRKRLQTLVSSELAAEALRTIALYGWLRATELGRLIYGNDIHCRKYSEKLIRKLMKLRMLIARPLPGRHAGTAYVLSRRGAEQLNEWSSEPSYSSGKDWGYVDEVGWHPPKSWKHDLLAVGVLSHMKTLSNNVEVMNERLLRSREPEARKHPDGITVLRERGFSVWLEVEHTRKSGRNLIQLVEAVVLASRKKPMHVYDGLHDAPISLGCIAIDANATDERGYKLNHWSRIETAILKRRIQGPVQLLIAWMKLKGVGVESVEFELKTVEPGRV